MKSKKRILREMNESKKIHDAGKYSSEDRSSIENIVKIIINKGFADGVVVEVDETAFPEVDNDVTEKMKDLLN